MGMPIFGNSFSESQGHIYAANGAAHQELTTAVHPGCPIAPV